MPSKNSPLTPPDILVESIAAWFKAIGDPSRVRLLMVLKEGETSVSDLVARTGIGQASVSKHLGILRQAGVVSLRRDGRLAIYSLKGEVPLKVCQLVCEDLRVEQQRAAAAFRKTHFHS